MPFVLGERIYSCFVYSAPIFAPQMHNCTSLNARRLAGSAPSLSDSSFYEMHLASPTCPVKQILKTIILMPFLGGNRDTDSIILIDNSSAWPPAVWPFWSFETNFIQSTLLDRKDTRTQLCCMSYAIWRVEFFCLLPLSRVCAQHIKKMEKASRKKTHLRCCKCNLSTLLAFTRGKYPSLVSSITSKCSQSLLWSRISGEICRSRVVN